MRLRLQEIENDPNSEFLSFSVKGVSSPEGPYQSNLKLAQKRTDSTLKRIFGFLNGGTIDAIKDSTYTEGVVASWEEVAELMEHDSLPTDKLREIPQLLSGQHGLAIQPDPTTTRNTGMSF